MIRNKPATAITAADILQLVQNRVPESRTLEYKATLPGNSDEERREFLADVCAFANTNGGDILYGIVETRANGRATGIPASAPGLAIAGDVELRRLEEMVRDGIAPRVPNFQGRVIPEFEQGAVVMLRVGRSWRRPHMVTFKNYARFFARAASGKYQLDVDQIGEAFTRAALLHERVDALRLARLDDIRNNRIVPPLAGGPRIALHVIPIAGLDSPETVDLDLQAARPRPLFAASGAGQFRYNFDGVMGYELQQSGQCSDYVQVFRNGTIEGVDTELLDRIGREREHVIPSLSFEGRLIDSLEGYFSDLQRWGLSPPYVVGLSLLNVQGFTLSLLLDQADRMGGARPIDRGDVIVPSALVEELGEELHLEAVRVMRPILDIVWQSAGVFRSPHFDNGGVWNAAGLDYFPSR